MWDKITFELNTEGESVNFGTRLFNDNNIYAFETKALATIHRSATSNVDKTPHSFKPISVSHEKTICIAVENTLVIFDATCSEVLLNLHFDSRITTFKMCNDGIFLFIALNNLEIYCVHCMLGKYERIFLNAETSFQIKPQLNITNKVVSICIDHIESRDAIHLFFVFSCGMIVRLSELDMKSLNELFNCDDSQKSIENIFANVTYCKLLTTLTKSRDAVEAVCEFKRSLFISNGKILIKCPLYDIHPCADNTNSEIDIRRSSIECSLPTGIVLEKLECTQKLLLSKTADEKLIIICPFTLSCQCFLPYDTCVDFTVVKGKLEETILIFTAYKIISLSNNDFSENYIINLPKKSLPVYNQNEDDPSFEEILFVELSDEKSLTIKVLEETQPHARLEKLLRKGRFEEAKKFCTFFSLDIQLVHCAEAARMFEELMPWVQSKTVTVDKFIALLELIEDIEFVGRYCINAITADLRDIRKLLDYGMNRIKLYLSKTSKSEAQFTNEESRSLHKLHSDMGSVVLRLNTYIIIHDTSSASADQWISFSKANLLYEIRGHLRKGELNAAKTIWCRHWNEIREESKFQEAIEMLNDVPDTLSVEESADWTKQMVSNVLLNDPSSLESIISWTMKKILSLDLIDKDNWLEKGISLAELMIDILLKLEESEAAIGLEHILIEKLNSFLKTLHQISCLKNVYHTNITYNHFVEENFNEVVFFLLTKTPVDSITNLINDFLSQILMDKRLDSDSVYSYCIERLVRFLPVELVYPGAPWEIRAVKITRAIFATQTRLECVVNLLKAAAVPLSTFILETVDEALALNHPLTGAIREQLVLVPSKLVLEKYGFTEIYNDEHRESIMHFIINSEDENNLADSLIIAKTINMEDDVYTGFITKFIREGNYGKVMELMGKLEPDVRERIQKRINLQVKLMRDIDINQLQIYRQYCSSLDQDLSRSCQLELDLDIKSNVADMHKKEKNEEFADIAFKQLIHECVRDKKAIYHITQKVSKLSEIFNIPHHSIILKLASLTLCEGKGDLAIELLSYFVESTMGCIDYKLCRELLDFLGKHICNLATYIQNSLKPIEVSSMLKTLSNMCLESSHASSILQAVEISIWVNLITGCRPQVTLFSEDFPSARLFQFLPDIVNSILEKYISFADVSNNRIVQNTFRNSIIPASNYTANDIASLLKSVLNNLAQIEQSTVSLQVVTDLYCSLSSVTKNAIETVESKSENGACNEWSVVMKTESWEAQFNRCLSEILQRVIMKKVPGKHFDLTVGLAMLNGYSEEEAFCWLKNQLEANLFNAKRTMAVSILGAFYWKLKNNDNMHSTYMASILKGQWGDKLSKLGLPYKEFITMDKREVVMKLLTIPNIDLDILRDYCSAFHFDFNDCLMKYVKHLVLSWEPDMSVTVDASGARVLHVKNTTDDILVKMKSVSALVDNHLEFMEYFTIILWKEVNCYYYELYIALLELFDHVSEQLSDKTFLSREQFLSMKQYKNILKFLINYRRISPTTSQEEDLFFMDYNYMHTLPAISEFRLPFTYLVADKYTILKSELSLSTYKLWFSVSSLLLLDKSTLCSLAIYRMNLEKLTSDTNKLKEEWIHVCNEKLLEDIKECVSYIEDNEKACACLFFVVNNLPPGADQVTVAQMCYNHTAKWASGKEVGSVAQQRFEKVHKKLLKVSTTHILYKYNLARREYLDLVLDPTLLICSLYKDPAILSRTDVKLVHFPDINEAVTEIGELHKVKTASIKMELVEKWLVPDSNLDDLMMSESYTIKSVAKLTEDDNLARVCYVLRYGTPSLACNYLVSIAFTNEMQPIEVKLRALQCLIKVVTPQQILDATGKDLSDIRRYMKSLWFVYGLEQLGLNCAVKTFSSRNKLELVEEILNQQSPASATLAAHLCCEYELHNPNYWNTIFKRFIESAMLLVDQMEEFIFRLKIDWYLLDQEILSSAWNRLIFLRLSMVDELSEDKESQVKKILENISKCPSPALLKRETIMDQLKRLNCRNLCSQYAIFL